MADNSSGWMGFICVFMLLFFVGLGCYINGHNKGVETMKLEAVKVGAAEWMPNEEGAATFTWRK